MTTPPEPTTIAAELAAELAAMKRIAAALRPLDQRAQARVIGWLVDRYEPDQELLADREDVIR